MPETASKYDVSGLKEFLKAVYKEAYYELRDELIAKASATLDSMGPETPTSDAPPVASEPWPADAEVVIEPVAEQGPINPME